MGHSATISYKLKETDENKEKKAQIIFNRNIDCFNDEQKSHVNDKLKNLMHIFEYCDQGTDLNVTDEVLQEQ